jgi:hypothetical protein
MNKLTYVEKDFLNDPWKHFELLLESHSIGICSISKDAKTPAQLCVTCITGALFDDLNKRLKQLEHDKAG